MAVVAENSRHADQSGPVLPRQLPGTSADVRRICPAQLIIGLCGLPPAPAPPPAAAGWPHTRPHFPVPPPLQEVLAAAEELTLDQLMAAAAVVRDAGHSHITFSPKVPTELWLSSLHITPQVATELWLSSLHITRRCSSLSPSSAATHAGTVPLPGRPCPAAAPT